MSRVSYPLSGGGSGLDIAAIQNPGSTEAELNFALRNRTLGFGYDPQNSNGLNFCIKQGLVQYDVTGSVYDIDNATVTLPDNTTCAIILCPELPYADRFQVLDYNAYTTRQMPLTRLVLYEVSTSNGSVVGITDRRMAQPLSFASWGGLSDFAFIRTEVNPGFGGSGIVAHIKAGRVATSAGMVSFGDAPYVLLTDNAVNYVELDVGAVTVTANPNSFNGSNIPLYILYVENGVCTTAQDYRAFLSVPGSSGIAKRELEITLTPDGLVLTQDQMCYDIIVVNTYGSGGPEDLYVPEVNSDIRLWGHQVIIQFGQWANTADTVRVHNTTNDHAWTAKDAAGNDLFALSDASPYVTLGSPGDSVSITGHAPMFCLDGDVMWANWDAPALQFDYATVLQGIKQINSLPLVPLPLVAAVPVDTFPYVLRMNDTMAYVWHDGAQNNMFEVVDMSVPVLPRTNRILGGLSASRRRAG